MMGTKEQFEEWLKARPATWSALGGIACLCPLAKWLNDTRGGSWSVGTTRYFDSDSEESYHVPHWAYKFILKVDAGRTAPISALRCIEILEGQS